MKTIVLDLDGTMYRGSECIDSAKRFIDRCYKAGIPYVFLTNNSMRTQEENAQHMIDMGYEHIEPSQFFNSAMASTQYVAKNSAQRKAYYIGKNGMKEALEKEGFELVEQDPDFVFVGLNKECTYASYSKALSFLLQGAKLIGTNNDRILAKPGGFEVGNGSIVAMFEYASKQESPKIAKPYRPMLDLCLEHFGLKKEDIILVGDNLETDIALGYNNNVETLLVETGVHQREDIEALKIYPTQVVKNLDDFEVEKLVNL